MHQGVDESRIKASSRSVIIDANHCNRRPHRRMTMEWMRAGRGPTIAGMGSLGASSAAPATGSLGFHKPSELEQRLNDVTTVGALADLVQDIKPLLDAHYVPLAFQQTASAWQKGPGSSVGPGLDSHRQLQPLLDDLQDAAMRQLSQTDGQGLGSILSAYAKLGQAAASKQPLLDRISKEAVHRLNDCAIDSEPHMQLDAQALSNMVHAYAVLGHHPGSELLSAIAKGVQSQLRDFSPKVTLP